MKMPVRKKQTGLSKSGKPLISYVAAYKPENSKPKVYKQFSVQKYKSSAELLAWQTYNQYNYTNIEEWKQIPDFEYYISSKGRVKNSKGCILKCSLMRGYKQVSLYYAVGKSKVRLVHQLVAELYIPSIPGKDKIMFIDGDKSNIDRYNLKRCTQGEFIKHYYNLGRKPRDLSGENSPGHKLNNDIVRYLRSLDIKKYKMQDLADKYNVDKRTIYCAVNYKTWKDI